MIRKRKTAFEQDAFGWGRSVYKYLQKPGVARKAKKLTNRRERREIKKEINV